MSYLTAVHTEPGLVKKINQDSLCVMEARTGVGEILMAVICDGMGGLAKGEVASASVAQALSEWFVKELPTQITNDNFWQEIKLRWQQLLLDENQKISRYGKARGVQLGTTATAILLLNDEKYLIAHVGDSRVYCLDNQGIRQIRTTDAAGGGDRSTKKCSSTMRRGLSSYETRHVGGRITERTNNSSLFRWVSPGDFTRGTF